MSLSQNYRSTQRILRVAGEVIQHNEKSPLLPPKTLTTENPEGEKIRVVEFGTPEEEAYWVASEIERLHAAGAPWRDFAVLYRKHTHRAQMLDALRRQGIPFVIRKFSILSSTLVRDLLAWLRLIAVPGDNVSCARVLAAPYWGLEPRDLVRLAERAEKNHRRPLADELETAQREAPFNREGVQRSPNWCNCSKQLRQSAKKTATRSSGRIDRRAGPCAAALGQGPAIHRTVRRVREGVGEEERRQAAARFHRIPWLFRRSWMATSHLEEEAADDAVQLMTVHSAKGLEFPHVFILRARERRLPFRPAPAEIRIPAGTDEGGKAARAIFKFRRSGGCFTSRSRARSGN